MESAGMENDVDGVAVERTPKKRGKSILPAFYVSTLQTFETAGYFDASYKRRYPTPVEPSKIVSLGDGRQIEIVPTQKYGYPNAVDLDYKRALFRIIDEIAEPVERVDADGTKKTHHRISLPIFAHTKTFIRYAGRYPNPRERKILNNFLHRNAATRMHGEFEDPKTREFKRADVSLFSEVMTKGEATDEGLETEQHRIWLTPYAIRLYYWHRTRREDIAFHTQLMNPISKVLLPYLDSGWFAAFSAKGTDFKKSYASLCKFLGIPAYKHFSRIKQQLDPAHEELKSMGYLYEWGYQERGERGQKQHSIRWMPADKWFDDAEARGTSFTRPIRSEEPKEEPVVPLPNTQPLLLEAPREEQPALFSSEAEELVNLFYRLFHGAASPNIPQKAVAQAETLIQTHGVKTAQYIVEFAHQKAPDTEYSPSVFGGILHYEPIALAVREARKQREEEKAQQSHREHDEVVEAEAGEERDAELLANLPTDERETLFAEARRELLERFPSFNKDPDGFSAQGMMKNIVLSKIKGTPSPLLVD